MAIMGILIKDSYAGGACPVAENLPTLPENSFKIDTHNAIPPAIMNNIMTVNKAVDKKVARFIVLGDAVKCAAADFLSHEWSLLVIKIHVPNITLWLSGAIVWVVGVILTFVIGYYLCDISFKLGFAILAMPIAIGLWPFPLTKKYLGKVISLMLHCTGIFIFLCLGVTLAVALFDAAVTVGIAGTSSDGKDAMETMFGYFKEAERDNPASEIIANAFDLTSFNFLLLMFAGIYGFRLIGASVNKYTGKFFPDSTGLGSVNPMHQGLTQVTDFAKQQAEKVGALAKDTLKTQAGRGAAKLGGKISGAVARLGAGMSKAPGVGGKLGKGLQAMGNMGQKMAENHEAKYQNQGKQGDLKNGNWQPKDNGQDKGKQDGDKSGGGQDKEGGEK